MKLNTLFALAVEISFLGALAVAQIAAPPAGQPSNAPAAAPAPKRAAAPKPAAKKPPSQVDSVIQLVKGGMSEPFIIKYLQKNNKPADLAPEDMVKLKAAGVSETVIGVMMDPTSAPAPAVAAAPAVEVPPPAPEPVPAPPPPTPVPVAVPAPAPKSAPAIQAPKTISSGDWKGALQARLEQEYPLTQPTGDNTDIVTPGAVISLKKNKLAMYASASFSNQNTYKGGPTISNGFFGSLCQTSHDGSCRMFVRGEKFWVIEIAVKEDGVVFQFLSDPLPDERYHGALKFPFPKGTQPNPDEISAAAAQVLAVAAPAPLAAAPASAAPVQPLPPIAPPPPPGPALAPIAPPPPPPASVDLGQSKDQVVAALGQPERIANVGTTKQIYFFKNLKVTFVNGKVTDIQ
ncbi:MAG TPA: hypothetical protein VHY84_17400 [Bryobacteraceae bacterium]|jgi:hypothetical protein|nr:hypothetical protein [Bryobacteraceae bacterium]